MRKDEDCLSSQWKMAHSKVFWNWLMEDLVIWHVTCFESFVQSLTQVRDLGIYWKVEHCAWSKTDGLVEAGCDILFWRETLCSTGSLPQ